MPAPDVVARRPDQMASAKAKGQRGADTELLQSVQQLLRPAAAEGDLLGLFPAPFAAYAKDGLAARIAFKHAEQLTPAERDGVWALFEANMAAVYEADAQKWQPRAKRRELFHDDARYFLMTDEQGELLAFTHFRFEVEENLLEAEELAAAALPRYSPVLYCYELQAAPPARRKGVGRRLMQLLELVALKFKLHAVLLTVQRSNGGAHAFYGRLGYKQHPSCPERNGFEDFEGIDPGHRIMWKDLRR
ncbi:NAA40 [Scenedesmus sp. PABB004]|nr:NAA40 [Scenedesmus sp. PABB004]